MVKTNMDPKLFDYYNYVMGGLDQCSVCALRYVLHVVEAFLGKWSPMTDGWQKPPGWSIREICSKESFAKTNPHEGL